MNIKKFEEYWFQRIWRPTMAFLYCFLCLVDYAIRPAVNYYHYKDFSLRDTVSFIQPLEPSVQIQALILSKEKVAIEPILNEFVHISFGAILGVSAYSRYWQKIDEANAETKKKLT